MVGRGVALAPLIIALAALPAHSEDHEPDPREALQSLLSNALEVTIAARMLPADEKPIWNAQSTKVTIPGRSIRVRLDGDNVRIYLVCTPYVEDNGEVLLLAQGQVWFSTPTDKEIKYSSTFSSIPVSFGEKVLFFPMGITDAEAQKKGFVNIEVEIKIVPYAAAGERVPPRRPAAERVPPYASQAQAPVEPQQAQQQ
jgi:hypothetical protein